MKTRPDYKIKEHINLLYRIKEIYEKYKLQDFVEQIEREIKQLEIGLTFTPVTDGIKGNEKDINRLFYA